jgi:hypothetical protein
MRTRIIPNAKICECGATCFAPTTMFWTAIVDVEDARLLQDYKWSARGKAFNRVFYVCSLTYAKDTGKSELLHQAVTRHIHPALDHINRNGHDNRKVNLRLGGRKRLMRRLGLGYR